MPPGPLVVVDPQDPAPETIHRAAELIRAGRLLAFPTETVYGLGANALDAAAVRSIFHAKGRPPSNPLIVHVPDTASAQRLVTDWPPTAATLTAAFWPGPLTLVLPRSPEIPSEVTAGGDTVALRMPSHPVALALLRAAACPIAAPSANRATQLSPTTAQHVLRNLPNGFDLLLDGGPVSVGLESTVLDLTTTPPRVLRTGRITAEQLATTLRQPVDTGPTDAPIARAPGQQTRHYAPQTPLQLVPAAHLPTTAAELTRVGLSIATVAFAETTPSTPNILHHRDLGSNSEDAARLLYATLHELDQLAVDRILIAEPPAGPAWDAIRDRLRRAATV